ncbi:O-antigen ligase family protein [Pannonibacter phragmitetus]|uniref:O-antigen ligase family protein n=1 Tax=Pannonibacter phragmitetus TaxID=121719 RepID=UPI000B95CDAD|nr:O-antigen ligase family protein [Pannonibacter phragmitetus]
MSTGAAIAGQQGSGRRLLIPVSRISAAALWVAVFLGGFVIEEPAPYELFMAGLLVLWLLFGLRLRPEFGPLTVLLILFMAGGTMAVPFARDVPTAAMYMAVSGFLAATAIFYAAVVSADPGRLFLIERAYVASALLCASIGVAAYFRLFPGSEIFTLYGRARGTFQDPNVFGPFLVLPTVLLVHRLLTRGLFSSPATLLILPVLVLGIFLSFSRGAWGLLALSGILVYLLSLIHERRPRERLRLVLVGAGGLAAVLLLLAAALSIDSVAAMFSERARLVQDYDGARLGRFARYGMGFEMVMERPFGLGPLEFNKYFPEDEHNVYLKAFTSYGWLGGVVYPLLVIWTVAALVPLLFQHRPWTGFAHCVFAVLVGHALMSVIIDIDHWRHYFLLLGLAWGLIAIHKLEQKQRTVDLNARQVLRRAKEADRESPVVGQ